jgi:hypothetical protein
MRHLALTLLLAPAAAQAAWPEDVTISLMRDHGGQRISGPVTDDYEQLIRELGSAVGNKPIAPANTLGAFGFDVSLASSFVFVSANGTADDPSPWERATPDESPTGFGFVPGLSIRKGFAGSFDFGTTASWYGLTRQGVFGGFARLGLFEGVDPAPDVTVQVGYAGYLGNVELDMGVLDFGVRIGQVFPFGAFPDINTAQFSPFVDWSLLRISAVPRIDPAAEEAIGAVRYGFSNDEDAENALLVNRFSLGFQVTNGTAHFRVAGSLAPQGASSVNAGVGFTY